MIAWGDVYKVVVATAPLYVALFLGYASVRWWRMFKPDQCDAINRFNCYFIIPFFTFHFTATVNPYAMNFRFLAADMVAKSAAAAVLVLWANLGRREEKFSWAITSFSLSSLNNTLVVGVPLLTAMYGAAGEDLVIQSSVMQSLLWFPILLFLLEFRRATLNRHHSSIEIVEIVVNEHPTTTTTTTTMAAADHSKIPSSNFKATMMTVGLKLTKNPNCYACSLGLLWALIANRWHLEMPTIVEGSILIMAKAGSGVAMFTMGLFMALQEKIIACGLKLTIYSMVLRFLCGPIATTLGCLALGLRSNTLSIAIIQAALPQSIASFVFAQEYSLHADVLSTAVIFGTIVSLPIMIAYYVIQDALL